jgi:hypothetical protein
MNDEIDCRIIEVSIKIDIVRGNPSEGADVLPWLL